MNPETRSIRHLWLTTAKYSLAWAILAAMAVGARYRDPFGRSLEHPGYGENLPGDLALTLIWGACEWTVLLLILRPWQRERIRSRMVIALVLFLPWTLFASIFTMHAGSISASLVVWRLGIVVLLIGLSLALAVRADLRRGAAG